jgi:tRNA(Leu) C34 or U34 (ribose-2'-O)-methylase TrmL
MSSLHLEYVACCHGPLCHCTTAHGSWLGNCCRLKRAGLDYWEHVCVEVHESWEVCSPRRRGSVRHQALSCSVRHGCSCEWDTLAGCKNQATLMLGPRRVHSAQTPMQKLATAVVLFLWSAPRLTTMQQGLCLHCTVHVAVCGVVCGIMLTVV